MVRGRNFLTMVLAVWLAGFCSRVEAKTIYVDDSATGADTGTSWHHAFNYLQTALLPMAAEAGDEIRVAQGVYNPADGGFQPIAKENHFTLINEVVIRGGYAGVGTADPNARDIHTYETILTGDLAGNDDDEDPWTTAENSYQIFVVSSSIDETAILDGFTITAGGNAVGGPWDLYNGGGMMNEGDPTILNCTFYKNRAWYGGGLYNLGCPDISYCRFLNNLAVVNGGGINHKGNCLLRIRSSLIAENEAVLGGGLCSFDYESPVQLLNCSVANNTAQDSGGGIFLYNEYEFRSSTTNCIFWGNNAPLGHEIVAGDNGKLTVTYCNIQGGKAEIYQENSNVIWGEANLTVDPIFVGGSDFRLGSESSCIDMGNNTPFEEPLSEYDVGGNSRLQDGDGDMISIVDMGAFEYTYPHGASLFATVMKKLWFVEHVGGNYPVPQTLTIWNGGEGTLDWQLFEDCPWLEAVSTSGSCANGNSQVNISVNTTGLAEGKHTCILTLYDPHALNSPYTVEVVLWLFPANVAIVPLDYPTISDAFWGSLEIVLTPGIYTGIDNTYIIFEHSSQTLRSIEPTDSEVVAATVIDFEKSQYGITFFGSPFPFEQDPQLLGLTIQNGYVDNYIGGVILCEYENCSPTIQYCIFKNNQSNNGNGGAIWIWEQAHPRIIDCVFEDNTATTAGGAIFIWEAQADIQRCVFRRNSISDLMSSYGGGAIYTSFSSNTIINECLFQENVAGYGGAVRNDQGSISIYSSRFEGNRAPDGFGGGIYGPVKEIENCSFSGNTAANGGAVAEHSHFIGCSFVDNVAQGQGGAIWSWGGVRLIDCIVWGNADGSGTGTDSQIYPSEGSEVYHSCIQDADPDDGLIPFGRPLNPLYPNGGEENGNIDDDPRFVRDPDDGGDGWGVGDNDDYGDLHLRSDSPCIETGNGILKGNFYGEDIDGQVRFTGSRSDMGADEFTPLVMVTNPQEADVWAGGNRREITWEAEGLAGNLNLFYSVNNGMDWTLIEPNIPNTQSYDWQVPVIDANDCLIKLEAIEPPEYILYRDGGEFMIRTSTPGPPVVSSWPTLGKNFQRTGLSDFTGPEIGCVKWHFAADGPIRQGVVSGADGQVHFASEAGTLYTLDPNGALRWSYEIDSAITNTPTVGADGTVYFGCEDGWFRALDKDGQIRWTFHIEGPIQASAAVAIDGKVFIGSAGGVVYAIDPNGIELWQRVFDDEGSRSATFTASPTMGLDGSVYVGALYDPNLYALDPETGDIRWRCPLARLADPQQPELREITGSVYTSPVVAADGTIYVAPMHDTHLLAIDPIDGSILWRNDMTGASFSLFEPNYVQNYTGRLCWSAPAVGPEGTIYVSFDDPYLRAVNPDGTFKWITRLGLVGGFTTAVGQDGLIYAAADDGSMYVVNAAGEEVSRFDSSDWQRFAVVHYKFDEDSGLTARDSLGGKDVTLYNFTGDDSQWVPGKEGGALQFDGIDDYAEIRDVDDLSGGKSRQVSTWIKTSSIGVIVSWGRGDEGFLDAWTLWINEGKLKVSLLSQEPYAVVTGHTIVADDQWHHVRAVYKVKAYKEIISENPLQYESYDKVELYVDGKPDGFLWIPTQGEYDFGSNKITIGAFWDGSAYTLPFAGLMDELTIGFDLDSTLAHTAIGAEGTMYVTDSDHRVWALTGEGCSDEDRRLGRLSDFTTDGIVNLFDYALLGRDWMDCTDPANPVCSEDALYFVGDVNRDGYQDFADLIGFTRQWLQYD